MADIRVACATDEAYAPYCATMLQGLLRHHRQGLIVHLLHTEDFPAGLLDALRRLVERGGGRWQPIAARADSLVGLPRMPRIPSIMWLRCQLPELLPAADRLLYLDVDTLALEPLDALWATDLGPCLVGAADNVLRADLAARPAALGLPANIRYFNSGVLLMNLEAMRRERTSAQLLDCARQRAAELLWPDQDALNIVLAEKRKALHPRWNCQNSLFYWRARSIEVLGASDRAQALAAPALLHFEGPAWAKPWHFLSDHPYRPAWRAVQRATGWDLPRPDGLLKRALGHLPFACVGPLRSFLGYPRPDGTPRVSR